jgi:hypothetical protein
MAAIMDVIRSHLDQQTLESLGNRTGTDASTVQRVAAMALPLLVGGLSRNVHRSPQARSSLNAALERDHDGSLLDQLGSLLGGGGAGGGAGGGVGSLLGAVGGLLGGGEGAANPRAARGDGILSHVFGDRREAVEEGTARASGVDRGTVATLLATLAPLVMGALGRVKRERNLDEEGVAQLVDAERRDVEHAVPQAGEGDLLRLFEGAAGRDDVASWAERLAPALQGTLSSRKDSLN